MPTISPLSGMAEPPVSVMFAVTSSWLIPLAVAIRSLCVHSDPRRNYELHIVHHGLEEEQMKELGKAVSSYPRVSLGFCRLPERLLRILQHRDCGRFSPSHMDACWPPPCSPGTTGWFTWTWTCC